MTKVEIPVDECALCVVKGPKGMGTGFAFLKPNWVATAKHVVLSPTGGADPVRVLLRSAVELPARVAFVHPNVDLAVLAVEGEVCCRTPLLPGDSPAHGGLRWVGWRPSGDVASGCYTSFVSSVEQYERSVRARDGYEEILFKFPGPCGEPGHSGAPVLSATGAVIAVVIDDITLAGEHLMRATSIMGFLDHLSFES